VLKTFSELIKSDFGVLNSTAINLAEGGYRVVITGVHNATYTAWINLSKPFASAQLKNSTCDYVAMRGTAAPDDFFYNDPANGTPVKLPNDVKVFWSSTPASSIPDRELEELEPITFNPPLIDVTYNIQVTDSFGCVSDASFFYESFHVNAEFSAEPLVGDAPLEVSFTDNSIRANKKYTWDFGEKTDNGAPILWEVNKDSLWIFEQPVTHKYYIPGEYSVNLTIESEDCIDSFRLEQKIIVDPSDLEIPNVFTPNKDGLNDYFLPDIQSLRYIVVEIFSRSGIRVYHFVGADEELATWQGWDGNVNDTSIPASPGVYYYIIRARGWDEVDYDSKAQRGFLYLYR
jgi:gliding motility-associated-like protein